MAAFPTRAPECSTTHWATIRPTRRTSPGRSSPTTRSSATSSAGWTHGGREVGYWIGREYWGRGYATRGAPAPARGDRRSADHGAHRRPTTSGRSGSSSTAASSVSARSRRGRRPRGDLPARLEPGALAAPERASPPVSLRLVTDQPDPTSPPTADRPATADPNADPTPPRRPTDRPGPVQGRRPRRRSAARVSAASGSRSSSWSSSSS